MRNDARAVTTSPITPPEISRRAVSTSGQYWAFSATMNTRSVPAQRARIRSHASSVGAIGFSSSTWRPASKASPTRASVNRCGTMMSTASMPPAPMASASEPCTAAPNGPAVAAARTGSGSTQATTSMAAPDDSIP
jgi:hypothetical protein